MQKFKKDSSGHVQQVTKVKDGQKYTSRGDTSYPMTATQLGLYIACMHSPDSLQYNIPVRFRIPKRLGVDAQTLCTAIKTAADSFPFLKTCVCTKNETPALVYNPHISYDVTCIDAQHMSDADIEKDFIKPFDLNQGPLCYFRVYQQEEEFQFMADIHHLICDGSAFNVFLQQLINVIEGRELLQEDINSFDICNNEAQIVASEKYAQSKQYFDNLLDGVEVDSNLLTDEEVSPQEGSHREGSPQIDDAPGKSIAYNPAFKIYKKLLKNQDIQEKLRSQNIKESSYFLSAFAYTLSKMTGQNEALFCTISSARRAPELRNTMGMLVRTFPVYVEIDEEMSTWDYMTVVQQQFHESLRQDAYPFVNIANDHAVKPDVFFAYQGSILRGSELRGEFIAPEPIKLAPIANFALDVHKLEKASLPASLPASLTDVGTDVSDAVSDAYALWFEYDPNLYLAENIESFGEMMVCVLQDFLQGGPLHSVKFQVIPVSEENPPAIYKNFNSKRVPVDTSLNMLDLFRAQFTQHAKRQAISFQDRTLSYEELDTLSDRVAHALCKKGLNTTRTKQNVVGILVQRSERFPICAIGILKAGGICLPLDASYPSERLQYMLEDSGATCVIIDRDLQDILQNYTGTVLYTDEIQQEVAQVSPEQVSPEMDSHLPQIHAEPASPTVSPQELSSQEVSPQDIFAIIYTSGSTGTPKGVMLSHANLVNFCLSFQDFFKLDHNARASVYGSFSFDASMQEIYGYLTCGASIHIIPQEIRLDLPALHEFLLQKKISHVEFTTQVARQYVIQYPENPYIQALSCGGEKFISCPLPNYPLYNTYGPTEGTIYISQFLIDKEYASVPIGKPFANTDIYIVDPYGRALPLGAPGELCFAGPQVSLGYLNKPELTAEKFTQNPFQVIPVVSAEDAKRGFGIMYHTGDVCRYLPSGDIQYVGRRDEQVKIRGFRIELGEIEHRISEFNGIKDVCVIAKDLPSGDKALFAYVVAQDAVNIEALQSFIAEKLPYYMVPTTIIQLEALPLTPNGKIDKKRVSAVASGDTSSLTISPQAVLASSHTPMQGNNARELNILEKEITQIILELIGQEVALTDTLTPIDPTIDLMSLGLSSLSLMALSAKLYKKYGCRISVAQLLNGANIIQLENHVLQTLFQRNETEGSLTGSGDAVSDAVSLEVIPSAMLLSEAQLGVYYDSVKRPEALLYNIPILLECGSQVNASRLAQALKQVIALHPILDVHVETRQGVLVQVPNEKAALTSAVTEKHLTPQEFSVYKQNFVQPFSLDTGPLYRAAVITCEQEALPRNVYAFIDIHHLVFDGVSMGVFLQELQEAYNGTLPTVESMSFYTAMQLQNKQVEVIPLSPEAASLTGRGSASSLQEASLRAQKYYEALFANYEQASIITPDLKGKREDGALGEYVATIDIAPIQAFCKNNKLTLAHVFLAAAFYAVARFTAQDRVYISTISNGRDDIRFAETIGMFVQTLPLSAELSHGQSVLDFCLQSRHMLQEAIAYGHFPHLSIQQSFGYTPHINYACQLGLRDDIRLGESVVHSEILTNLLPKFDISIQIEERENVPAICVQYNDALYSKELIKRVATAMSVVVQNMVSAPNKDITQISMLTKEEASLLERFGNTSLSGNTCTEQPCVLEDTLMHRCFERQVQKTPQRTALIAGDGRWSYEKMNTAANQMAHTLLKHGLQKQERVLLLLPRIGIQVIAQYAVLKAGGVFIPCDPSYPKERILHIMQDSGANIIISTAQIAADWQGTAPTVSVLSVEQLQQNTEQGTLPVSDEVSPRAVSNARSLTKDDLAYMIFTSGSTGKPKGVMVTHGGISNHVHNHEANIYIHALAQEAKVMLSVTTVAFDLSINDTAGSLCNGLTVVLADDESANNPQRLTALVTRYNCDAFSATPSRMAQYLTYEPLVQALSRAKILLSGGEAFPLSLLQFLQRKTSARIINIYGPTEITISSNEKDLTHETEITEVPVGKPLLGVSEYIVDTHGNILPIGVMGELYIGGVGVSRGYCNREDLTARQFITFAGERVYKSGDYAKWNDAGDVVILGRCDRQLKLRGLRIEPGEIEQVIISYEGITQAVVRVRDFSGTEHLCAWFCATHEVDEADLKAYLQTKLTPYMVPIAYAQLSHFPVTPNGKLDEKELQTPQQKAALTKKSSYHEPKNELESMFCNIFSEVLQLEKVDVLDSFFDLGGSSLSVTNVLVMAQEKISLAGFTLSYGDIFANPTPRALAAKLLGDASLTAAPTQKEVSPRTDTTFSDVINYDYGKFDNILKNNTLQEYLLGKASLTYPLGNILLAGAVGFLGIHVLHSFLENETGIAYCVLRDKNGISAEKRLKTQLFYYFEKNYEELFGTRIFVIQGDVTKQDWQNELQYAPINTLINCAASVKHFAKDNEIEDVNVGSVKMMASFCKPRGIRFIHISTVSVAGDRINDIPAPSQNLTEEKFFFGQDVSNQYVHSKFMAERVIFEAMQDGLDAKIMRVGNLAARESDGEFQINFTTNASAGRLRAYNAIGVFPLSAMQTQMEFSPIDSTAKAVLLLAQTPSVCCVFHPFNNHNVFLGDVILTMRHLQMDIELVEDDEFQNKLDDAKGDSEKAQKLTTLLAYEQYGEYANAQSIEVDNAYTSQVLYRMGFAWPNTSNSYIHQFLQALSSLGFFDKGK